MKCSLIGGYAKYLTFSLSFPGFFYKNSNFSEFFLDFDNFSNFRSFVATLGIQESNGTPSSVH